MIRIALFAALLISVVLNPILEVMVKQVKPKDRQTARGWVFLVTSVIALAAFAVSKVLVGMTPEEAVIVAGGSYGAFVTHAARSLLGAPKS